MKIKGVIKAKKPNNKCPTENQSSKTWTLKFFNPTF